MTVGALRDKLKELPNHWEVAFDDLQGGRIPVESLRIEGQSSRGNTVYHKRVSLVILSDDRDLLGD